MTSVRYLESLISHAEKSQLPTSFKSRVVAALKYFHQQTLCDVGIRDKPETIKGNWLEFEILLHGTSLLDSFKKNQIAWNGFRKTLGVEDPKPYIPQKRASRYQGKDAKELFQELSRKAETQISLSEADLNLVRFGLFYLELEMSHGRMYRNNKRIRSVWKTIQPIMRRIGMLDEIGHDLDAVRRIKSAISDTL